jgi:hypothetical protein
MQKISIYTDRTKQKEFIDRMNEIVNRENSSIGFCAIERDFSNQYYLYLHPKNSRYTFNTFIFNFCSPEIYITQESDYEKYLSNGYSKEDIDLMANLLNDFCFENPLEGQFFASTFRKLAPIENSFSYIFKFTNDEDNSRIVIENQYFERFYVVVKKEYAAKLLEQLTVDDKISLTKVDRLEYYDRYNLKNALSQMESWSNNGKFEHVVMECYKHYEFISSLTYIKNIWFEKDGEVKNEEFKSLNIDFSSK